uniref:RUN domain-containing protein n=1 Tax=Panagrellus redivivus TaxID=6233 RepID=A0A7E4W410_PANRE
MFHDFVPNGLPQGPRKPKEVAANIVLNNVKTAVEGIKERSTVYLKPFNSIHPDTATVIKALDRFFSHGLILDEKCYWPFIKNFVTHHDESQLRLTWHAKRTRGMSLAWLKDALNSKSLHFQCGALMTCDRALFKKFYHDTACIKNVRRLEKFMRIIIVLNDIDFELLPPTDNSFESIPIALPSTTVVEPAAAEVVEVRSSKRNVKSNNGNQRSPNQDLDTSLSAEVALSQSLVEMTRDLGPIEIGDTAQHPANFEDYQQYMFEKVTSCHLFNTDQAADEEKIDSESEVPASTVENRNTDYSDDIIIKGDVSESEIGPGGDHVDVLEHLEEDEHDEETPTHEHEALPASEGKSEVKSMVDNFSDLVVTEPVPGMFSLENYEIIELGLSIFVDQGERYRKCYIVYTGHAVGRPLQRLLVLTERRLYLLSHHVSGSNVAVEASTSPQSVEDMRCNMKFESHASVLLNDIDFIFVGADYQSFTLECKTTKFTTLNSDHESRNLTIETGSMALSKAILSSVKQAIVEEFVHNPSIYTEGTPNVMTLRKFVNNELNTTNTGIMHHVMAYWVEYAASSFASEMTGLECYFRFREVRPKNWIKPFGDWKNAYFVLKGCKLYQFVDSTCKFAEQSWNLRNHIELVQDIDVKDENNVFQLTACDSTFGLQFCCPNIETKRTWIQSVNLALSNFDNSPQAVPCSLVVANDTLIFAQEGANCAVDGFMRLLKRIDISDVADVVSVHTESVFVVVLEHKNASTDWIVLRTQAELRRLESTLHLKCGIQVTDSVDDQHFGGDKSNILYKQCTKMNDYWRNAPVDDGFEAQAQAAANL